MEKILIGIKDEFLGKIYVDFFREEGFSVLRAGNEDEIEKIISQNSLDVVLLDIVFAEKNNFNLLKKIKEGDSTKKMPVIILSKTDKEGYKEKAVEFEVKDLIVGDYISPLNLLAKIKTHLGKEKSYKIKADPNSESIRDLAKDLGYDSNVSCSECSGPMDIVMLRDLSKGKNYFKVSFICPSCLK